MRLFQDRAAEYPSSIIMVHGLKGHPYKTWRRKQNPNNMDKPSTHPEKEAPKPRTSKRLELRQSFKAFLKGSSSSSRQDSSLTESTSNTVPALENGDLTVFWPADLLPQNCKKARILTFGNDTKITKFTSGPTNTNSIFSHGKDFLFSLGREYVPDRPMIFVAHSLGGILVKEVTIYSIFISIPADRFRCSHYRQLRTLQHTKALSNQLQLSYSLARPIEGVLNCQPLVSGQGQCLVV